MNEQQLKAFLIERFTEPGSVARELLSSGEVNDSTVIAFIDLPFRMIVAAVAENNRRWEDRLRQVGINLPPEE